MPRPMPEPALMTGKQLTASAILTLLPLAIHPFWMAGFRAKLLLTAASFFLVLQFFLGPARRRSSTSLVRYGSWVAYHAPSYLAAHAVANVYRLSSDEEMDILAWGIVLCHTLNPMPYMVAYYAGDRYGSMCRMLNNFKSLAFAFSILLAVYVAKACTVMSFVLLLSHLVIHFSARVVIPLHLPSMLHTYAAAPSDEEDLVCYMSFLRLLKPIWHYGTSSIGDLRWLIPKATEFLSHEEGDEKIKRAFRMVEVQLAFLYDQFFTENSTVQVNMVDNMIADTSTFCFFATIFLRLLLNGLTLTLYSRSGLVLIALVLVLDFLRGPVFYARFLALDWGKAMSAHRLNQNRIDNLGNVIRCCRVVTMDYDGQSYWQEMIGQYSVLLDYNRGSTWKAVVAHVVAFAYAAWLPSISDMHYPREEEPASQLADLKLRIGYALADAHRQGIGITNGSRALVRNRVPEDAWLLTLQKENHADTILIWHVATCYLAMDYGEPPLTLHEMSNYQIATKLSKYCAYLVACLPELLPGDARATSEAFQSVVRDTKNALNDAKSEAIKYENMQRLPDDGSQSTFAAGVRLGMRLQGIFPNVDDMQARWKAMASFWVETMLYIAASSHNSAKHIEMLAQGGELITHIWALLFNTKMTTPARQNSR